MASSTKKRKPTNHFLFDEPDSNLSGPFRDNIRFFLHNFAELENYTVNGMRVWCTALVSDDEGIVPLYTVEETVDKTMLKNNDNDPFCNHCRLSGWGHHFVCKRKYHLIIRDKRSWNRPLEANFSQVEDHALYGLIHCNGYGHLICVNGFRSHPKILTASDAMELWNHLCSVLKTRKISVCDVWTKGSVQLRLIHSVAYGQSWFGKWAYKFSGGSSGITEQRYEMSIRLLNSLSLDKIVSDFKKLRYGKKVKCVIEKYRNLSVRPLVTTGDLLLFMMGIESRNFAIHGSNSCRFGSDMNRSPMGFDRFVRSLVKGDCRWPARRLKHVLAVIVNLLKLHKANVMDGRCGMSRCELREEARKSIGDTGLIDFVLKSIECFEIDNHIIRRAINPSGGLVEFTIHDELDERKRKNSGMGNQIVYRRKNPITKRIEFAVTENIDVPPVTDDFPDMKLSQDLLFFYENVLLGYPEKSSVSFAARVVLDSKQFLREWPTEGEVMSELMALRCQVLPSFDELETELTQPLSPGEVVVVPPSITICDLKQVVQFALRDTYCIMDEFVVRQIGGLRSVEDQKDLGCAIDSDGHVWVRGSGLDLGFVSEV